MDRPIEEKIVVRKKRRSYLIATIAILLVLAVALLLYTYFKPSLKRTEFTTAIAETGDIENTINATGEVLPEFEEILTSPINASIKKVLMDAGRKVSAGTSVLTLDKSIAQTEFDKLEFQIESKENDIRKLKLDLDKSFYDVKSTNNIKQLRINSLKDGVAAAKRLFNAGGGTREEIEQAELNLKVAELEKQQLENEIKSKQQTMKIEIREAEIALAIQRSDLAALKRKLNLAEVVASRDGVVTWVNKNIGANIQEGQELARIADLSSFRIAGAMADNLMEQLHNTMPAIIRIGDTLLRGSVVNISPAVKNNLVSFDVQLNERNNRLLRPNMKVDVFLVTKSQKNVVRVTNGATFNGSGEQYVFVIKNGKAERRLVKTGLSNFDHIQIINGINPGEEVITSDMSAFDRTKVVDIK